MKHSALSLCRVLAQVHTSTVLKLVISSGVRSLLAGMKAPTRELISPLLGLLLYAPLLQLQNTAVPKQALQRTISLPARVSPHLFSRHSGKTEVIASLKKGRRTRVMLEVVTMWSRNSWVGQGDVGAM